MKTRSWVNVENTEKTASFRTLSYVYCAYDGLDGVFHSFKKLVGAVCILCGT